MIQIITTNSLKRDLLFQVSEGILSGEKIDWDSIIQYCKNNNLLGLSLPQIGISKSGFVFKNKGRWDIVINPRIIKKSKITYFDIESCISVPGKYGKVERSLYILSEIYDSNYKKKTILLTPPESRIFQHEYDHLNGVLFTSYLNNNGNY